MKITNRKKRGLWGVTLVETAISMGLFGVSFVSLYAGMSVGFSIVGSARENLRATQVMLEKMETIRLYSWDQINASGFIPATFTESYDPTGGGTSSWGSGVEFHGKVTIGSGPTGHSYSADVKRVTVDLTWTSGSRTQRRSMSTFVSKHGLQRHIY